jgi:hypothetical protein
VTELIPTPYFRLHERKIRELNKSQPLPSKICLVNYIYIERERERERENCGCMNGTNDIGGKQKGDRRKRE